MTTDQETPLLIDEQGGVAWLTMNRPERLNAMNPALVDALRHYFQALPRRVHGVQALWPVHRQPGDAALLVDQKGGFLVGGHHSALEITSFMISLVPP